MPSCRKLLSVTLLLNVVKVNNAALELTAIPDSCDPLPMRNAPVTLPTALTSPPTLSTPAVIILPPVTLPEALTLVPALMFVPAISPDAATAPVVTRLPLRTLPVTLNVPNVPTVVKLLVTTLELNVVPVIRAAAATDTTPVSWLPLPMKNCPAVMLPMALIALLATKVPVTVAPDVVTVITLAVPCGLINIAPLFNMLMLLVPFEIPLTPPAANN